MANKAEAAGLIQRILEKLIEWNKKGGELRGKAWQRIKTAPTWQKVVGGTLGVGGLGTGGYFGYRALSGRKRRRR